MSTSELEKLRDIILRPDQERLERLSDRVESPEQRAADVAEVLPDSINTSFNDDRRFIGALRRPVKQCIAESVRNEPEEFASALFPVMGPAIRRSIRETLRAWTQQFSQAIEHSFSPRGLRWRIEAWRAGVPFGLYAFQKTLVYRVEDVYLIHSATGLLIGHVTQNAESLRDEDAVSAMFTAIQSFVNDSFSRGDKERLTTAELGELTLWAVHGPNSSIVAVIRGLAPIELRNRLESAIEDIERTKAETLPAYDGNRESMQDVEPVLESCLVMAVREQESAKPPIAAWAVAGIAAIALIAWFVYDYRLDARASTAVDELARTPGIVVTDSQRNGRTLNVSGLQDRLAGEPASVLAGAGWDGAVEAQFRPFLSLDDEVVYIRAIDTLNPPAGVSLALSDATLSVSGTASADWLESVRSVWRTIAGIEQIDVSGLTVEQVVDEEAERARMLAQMADLEARIGALVIRFERGQSDAIAASQADVAQVGQLLGSYAAIAENVGVSPRLTITGHSDQTGTPEINRALELERARSVAAALAAAGVPADWLLARGLSDTNAAGPREPAVMFTLQADTSGASAE